MINAVIEVAVGLIVLYSLFSLLSSNVNEILATAFRLRARTLRSAIRHLVGDKRVDQIYDHPMIRGLYRDGGPARRSGIRRFFAPLPSYIPADKFVIALLDGTAPTAVTADPPLPPDPRARIVAASAAEAGGEPDAMPPRPRTPEPVAAAITAELDGLPEGRLKKSLQTIWRAASHDVIAFRAGVEDWFNHTMDRASGWYKRNTRIMLMVLGVAFAAGLNVDTIRVTQALWMGGPLRAAVTEEVKKLPPPATTTTSPTPASTPTTLPGAATTTTVGSLGDQVGHIQDDLHRIGGLQLPLGWGTQQRPANYLVAGVGWLLTALALSLGAPFWFDLLGKVSALRGGGTKEATPAQAAGKKV